ncbi:uncharacterized protein LOC142332682 [Lycorma delicatula]|uniref:uncharacterized protein LOC142332682 n=1 Tax=Lycorma delicatula TaxID=130591 RepID=UPI003F511C7E
MSLKMLLLSTVLQLSDSNEDGKLNPTVDIVFKKLFGVEKNSDLLMEILNSIISEEHQLQELSIINGYDMIYYKIDKLNLLEVEGKGKNGRRYRFQIELLEDGIYNNKGLDDWSTKFSNRIEDSLYFVDVYKGIGIHFLFSDCIKNNSNYHNIFPITEEVGVQFFTDIEIHTIELHKFAKMFNGRNINELVEQIKTPLDKWMIFLTKQKLINRFSLPKELSNCKFRKALLELHNLNLNVEESHLYDRHQNFLL